MRSSFFEPHMSLEQTNEGRSLIFCMETCIVTLFWATDQIFEFQPRSRDMSKFWGFQGSRIMVQKLSNFGYISASRPKLENCLNIEKTLTLSYNVSLLGQIFELRHSPSSGTITNENVQAKICKVIQSQIERSHETKTKKLKICQIYGWSVW